VLAVLCRGLCAVAETRLLCPPRWTAYVGQRWDVVDVAPWNLYNVWWRVGQVVVARLLE
jgi:hypothetical protein